MRPQHEERLLYCRKIEAVQEALTSKTHTCTLCPGSQFSASNWTNHRNSRTHKDNLQRSQEPQQVTDDETLFELPEDIPFGSGSIPQPRQALWPIIENDAWAGKQNTSTEYDDAILFEQHDDAPVDTNWDGEEEQVGASGWTETGSENEWEDLPDGILPGEQTRSKDRPSLTRQQIMARLEARNARGDWKPYPSLEHFIACWLTSLHRLRVSRALYTYIRHAMSLFEVHLPSWATVRETKSAIRKITRAPRINSYTSAKGNQCSVLDIGEVIAREVANPVISPHIITLPEDTENTLSHPCQAEKWLYPSHPDLRAPMVEVFSSHYYIGELCQLALPNRFCIPLRFYRKSGQVMASALLLIRLPDLATSFKLLDNEIQMDTAKFRKPFSSLDISANDLRFFAEDGARLDAKITMPHPLRAPAGGRPVIYVPCHISNDDSSGNVSKKWNKHHVGQGVIAGLPFELGVKAYARLNLGVTQAGPLELFEGIITDVNRSTSQGVVTWSAHLRREVLVISGIHDMIADNPMHAEIACLLQGNSISRVNTLRASQADHRTSEYVHLFLGKEVQLSPRSTLVHPKKRVWSDTKRRVIASLEEAGKPGMIGKSSQTTSEEGIKDTMANHFMEQLHNISRKNFDSDLATAIKAADLFQSSKSIEVVLQAAVDHMLEKYGARCINPCFSLIGFDGHLDTPLELLHVVLLGYVKYFWRDTVNRLGKHDRTRLVVILSSCETTVISDTSLDGQYLLQYANSLVGKDFKALLQVVHIALAHLGEHAPNLRVWQSLARLSSFLYQHSINDLATYCDSLRHEIDVFLLRTIYLSAQWTNKPKFHILHFAEDYIRRLGPLPFLMAEIFEHGNGDFRGHVTHTNRAKPGRDVANAYANVSELRHLISGGYYNDADKGCKANWTQAGQGIQKLFDDSIIRQSIGIGPQETLKVPETTVGTPTDLRAEDYLQSIAFRVTAILPNSDVSLKAYKAIIALSAEKVAIQTFACIKIDNAQCICYIHEIMSLNSNTGIVVQKCILGAVSSHYELPTLRREVLEVGLASNQIVIISPQDVLYPINVQHDCVKSKCVEHQKVTCANQNSETKQITQMRVLHTDEINYVINSATLRHSEAIRELCHLDNKLFKPVGELSDTEIIETGVTNWITTASKIEEKESKKSGKAKCRSKVQKKAKASPDLVAPIARRSLRAKRKYDSLKEESLSEEDESEGERDNSGEESSEYDSDSTACSMYNGG